MTKHHTDAAPELEDRITTQHEPQHPTNHRKLSRLCPEILWHLGAIFACLSKPESLCTPCCPYHLGILTHFQAFCQKAGRIPEQQVSECALPLLCLPAPCTGPFPQYAHERIGLHAGTPCTPSPWLPS